MSWSKLTLLSLFWSGMMYGQNFLPEPEVILENNVKSVEINNCLAESFCFQTHYEFGECGKYKLWNPSILGTYWEYEYDENCQTAIVYSKSKNYGPNDLWVKELYLWDDTNSGSIIRYEYDQKEDLINTDTNIFIMTEMDTKMINNSEGQLVEQVIGELRYPCGIIYKGEHTAKFEYSDNGLIEKVEIYNSKDSLIVDLTYEYILGSQEE